MKLLAFSGPSDSGKTWMIERLARRWTALGLRVGVLKHCSKGYDLDHDGKDSSRFWNSGAEAVAVVGPGEWTVRRREPQADPRRIAEIAFPEGLDVAIVEGFRETQLPRVVVRPAGTHPALHGALATVARAPEPGGSLPEFALTDDEGLSRFLLASLGLAAAEPAPLAVSRATSA
jgi:molybdopterin-guanine dinucleotide biosynthesis adapter protein